MAVDSKELFELLKTSTKEPETATPDKSLDAHVQKIFEQAHGHRDRLIKFYICYTVILSALVMVLIFWQAALRCFVHGKAQLELIPQWALNLIVVGMFGQFIGLLTIVTKRVWEFKPFFDHAKKNKG
jgi:hypothetical protein